MVFGMETSELFGCGQFNGTPRCDAAQIDRQLAEFHALGVRSVFPVHKFDNALGGTRFDNGATGVLVNAGNKYATGQFWHGRAVRPTPTTTTSRRTSSRWPPSSRRCSTRSPRRASSPGQLPVYPPGPLCNPKGLTALGAHLIQR